ncbi:MAG TPA: cytochrome P450 [Pseudonocardiaceae bacterium]|nr:cytochrome P450 [Pseudonocardiaceae bacterium]
MATGDTKPTLIDGGAEQLAWLARMRAERPHWVDANGGHHLFRYADVQQVLSDPRFSSNIGRLMPFLDPDQLAENLVWTDPPAHRPLRGLVSQAFTPKTVARLRPRIADIAADLVTGLPDGEFDIVDALAYPLPLIVIAELLGVSPADRAFFKNRIDSSLGLRLDPALPPEELARIVADATKDLDAYLLAEVRRRREHPSDDLLGGLVAAELDGERLSDRRAAALATTLLTAGYVTTTLLLGNVLLCLRDNPDVERHLRADRSLVPGAIEEVLRCRPPAHQAYRIATENVPVAGDVVPANGFVTISMLSANHDERQFPDPDRFDPRRDPNKHLSFGHGIHFCLGAPLARLEVDIALNRLFDELAELHVSDDITFHDTDFYGAKRMTVSARR